MLTSLAEFARNSSHTRTSISTAKLWKALPVGIFYYDSTTFLLRSPMILAPSINHNLLKSFQICHLFLCDFQGFRASECSHHFLSWASMSQFCWSTKNVPLIYCTVYEFQGVGKVPSKNTRLALFNLAFTLLFFAWFVIFSCVYRSLKVNVTVNEWMWTVQFAIIEYGWRQTVHIVASEHQGRNSILYVQATCKNQFKNHQQLTLYSQ